MSKPKPEPSLIMEGIVFANAKNGFVWHKKYIIRVIIDQNKS